MATPADSRAVKSLNNAKGRKRFVFKSSSQRINDTEIKVARKSLDKVKDHPSEGSTFFKDSLVELREEMLPFVQTLQLVKLQKELIFSKLVSGLHMKARLSLEAFLRLIAALSRDIEKDFMPFLPRLVNSLVTLLKNGGGQDEEIIEQIFLSLKAILNDLQKYLICDIEGFLRDTLELRYYSEYYITDKFVAPSVSFLLRTAQDEQLEIGIKMILSEVEDPLRKSGGVSLLYHVMRRGISMSLHSKASKVLKFLLKDSTLSFCDNFPQGSSSSTVEVVSSTLQRICEDIKVEELTAMWNCLYQETKEAIIKKKSAHLSRLLTVLASAVRVEKGLKVYDCPCLFGLVSEIVSTFMDSSDTVVLDKVFGLMLCTIDRPSAINEMESIASQWSPIFSLKGSSLLTFLRELLEKDVLIVKAFTSNILSWINNMILGSWEEVIPLLLSLCERQKTSNYIVDEPFESRFERIHEFLEENIKKVRMKIENTGLSQIDEAEFAVVWGSVNCYPYFKVDSSLLIYFKNTLKQHLAASVVNTFSAQELKWQSLLGATLRSCHKLCSSERLIHSDLEEALSLAKCYKSCVQVLSSVADYLDFVYKPLLANDDSSKACPEELKANSAEVAFDIFSENLRHSNKDVRLTTLRILCHFETLSPNSSSEEHPPKKKLKTQVIQKSFPERNVLQLLHTVEKSPITVSTQTELVSFITRIQMDLSAWRVHEAYMPLVFNGMIGIFHNRYSKICEQASECLAVLMNKHTGAVWNDFVSYFGHSQVKLEAQHNHTESEKYNISEKHADSTPTATVVSLLLQTIQKVPTVVQSRASEILPLFLAFLGYNSENSTRVGLYNGEACKGEEWKKLLIQWLNLLKLMKNLNSSRLSLFVNDVLKNRFLDDNDAEIQTNVLQCLMLWNDYLLPHRSHLENLIKTEELREELVTWNLFKDIENAHRPHLVSLVIRILMPKVRNLKNSASRKHTSIRHRKAVLCFLSQFDVNELSLFFALLMKPFNIISEEAMDLFCSSGKTSLDSFHESNLLKYFTVDTISKLSRKQKSGFLHVIEHILEVFDEFHVRPFLDFLMGCVVRLLVNYAPNTDDKSNIDNSTNQEQAGSSLKQFKELRSLCLKIIAHVLTKYEDCDLGSEFWDLFFSAMNPLIKSFKQEGSSSEKPSSLFSCFLSMSKSSSLVPLLCQEESLIPDIFSILTVTTASEDIKSYALKFIENLLILDHELEEHESMIKGFLDPYIEPLIISLHSLFIGDKSKRKSVKYKGERVIKILKLFSKHIVRDESCVTKYLDILLSFLDRSVKDSGIHREALLAIQDITPLLRTESTRKIINTISPLLVETKLDVRLCICDLLESLAKIDSSLVLVAKCVSDMNAIAPMEVDELDYDTIINAYEKIDAEFFNKFSEQHIMIILSQSLYNISSKELTLKDSACNLLCTFIEFSASILCQEVSESNASWTGDRVLRIMNKFILKHIGDAVNRGKSSGKEEIRLIRKMVTTLPDCGNLAAFKPLCSENSEVDFFKNIFSIQSHRRAKAITGFAKVIKDNSLPEGVVRNILVSVFFKMLLDEQEVKNRNVQDACKEAIASVSAHMSWNSYYALLNRCFYEMKKHTNKRELLLQLIFLILNNFHFPKDEAMFLMIKKLMDSDTDSDRVKLNIYVAAVKALKLLPKEIMEPQLDSIVPKICSYLKSKDTHTRDEARKALASCLMELGLEYLQFFVKILLARLTRGSELHILGRTVNSILSKCLPSPTVGELDHCLEDLLAVAKTVIFGDFDERDEKRESRFSIKKETEKRKWLETLKLISENVSFENLTFRSQTLKLLSPVTEHLQKHLTPKLKSKLEEMVKYIAAGIEANQSVDQEEFFCFVYDHVDDGINNKNLSGLEDKVSKKKRKSTETKSYPHLITVFALELLHNRLKRIQPNNTNEKFLSMLDPFVKLLVGCLSSKYEDVVSLSVRCFTSLSRLKLPSLMSEADKVMSAVLTIIAQSPVMSSTSSLVQSCLNLLKALVFNEDFNLSSGKLKMLIQSPMFDDLESDSSVESSLSFIKAIVKKKVQDPKVYDIIADQVSKLMITTHEESIRKKCKEILLEFLVYYTLSKKRVEQHFSFLVNNLSYKHSIGRQAVFDVLQTLIGKFSKSDDLGKQSVLDQHCGNLFLQLSHCLATDDTKDVLTKIGDVIKLLVCSISKDKVDSSLEQCLVWYKLENSQAIAAKVLGLFIEARKEAFPKRIRDLLMQEAKTILETVVQLQDTIEEGIVPIFWKEAYYTLVMIEKLLKQFPHLCFGKDLEDIWKMVFKLLSHPHEWLRTISCRFLNHYFKALDGRKRKKLVVDSLLEKPSSLFMVASSLCSQLKERRTTGNEKDDANTEKIITANIVFAVSGLHTLIEQSDDHHEFWSSLDNDEQVVFLKAFEMLDSGKGRSTFLALTSGKRTANDVRNVLIGSLLKRMGKIALDTESLHMRIVFNVYKDFTSKLNKEECRLYAFRILFPLYKVCQGFTGKDISVELKQLAEEVRDSVRDECLGTQMFVQVYSEIKESLKRKREKRKLDVKEMAVINPERNAKRKLKLASKNKANKKRKIMRCKIDRWARS